MAEQTDEALVRDLLAVDDGLTDWELGFIESLAEFLFDKGRALTDRQRAKADQILRRVEGEG